MLRIMKKFLIAVTPAVLLFSACGGSSGSSAQSEVADLFISVANEQDLKLDESCVRTNADKFSDADAEMMVEAGVGGDPDISDAGDAIGDEILSGCVDAESYLEGLATSFSEDGSIDGDCIRAALKGLSVAEIDDQLFDVAFDCAID